MAGLFPLLASLASYVQGSASFVVCVGCWMLIGGCLIGCWVLVNFQNSLLKLRNLLTLVGVVCLEH
jgi:hypothetical protein